jgi:hypothetical protein
MIDIPATEINQSSSAVRRQENCGNCRLMAMFVDLLSALAVVILASTWSYVDREALVLGTGRRGSRDKRTDLTRLAGPVAFHE